jgi:hypothetical protein
MLLWKCKVASTETKLPWDIMAALGSPVVPEVYEKVRQSSFLTGTISFRFYLPVDKRESQLMKCTLLASSDF